MRLNVAPVDGLDRSLARIRLVVAAVVIVLSVRRLAEEPGSIAAMAGLVAGAVLPLSTVGERLGRRRFGAPIASMAVVALDTSLALAVLWFSDVEWGSATSLVLVLPLLEAGVRHGVFGAVATWMAITAVVAATSATEWDGTASDLSQPLQFVAILLLVSLPMAHLSEHLVDRVTVYATARHAAEHRADLLTAVLVASSNLVSPDPPEVDVALVAGARTITGGHVAVLDLGPSVTIDDESIAAASTHLDPDAPVQLADGSSTSRFAVVIGGGPGRVLCCTTDAPLDSYTTDAVELLCAHADIARHSAELYAIVRSDASHWERRARIDPLTGLLNRAGVIDHLDGLLSSSDNRIVVVYVDLDNFKSVNDTHGHDAGDTTLRSVADRLRSLGSSGFAGRLGGDEFLVARRLDDHEEPVTFAAQVSTVLAHDVELRSGVTVHVGASVGWSVTTVDGAETCDDLLVRADWSMYENKRARVAARFAAPPRTPRPVG